MKLLKKVIRFVFIYALAIMAFSSTSLAATVGDVLTYPETGWHRYEDSDPLIQYTGSWTVASTPGYTGNTIHYASDNTSYYKFKFKGTKVRIILPKYYGHSSQVSVKIDGVEEFYNEYSANLITNIIAYEKNGLSLGYHNVEVINLQNEKQIDIDAIDVDGYLIDINNPEPGGDITGNKAILEVVMTNGNIKEYDLTASEIGDFLTWYDNRSENIGRPYYKIPKRSNVKPFISRKEYLSYDKIYSFEVKDYNE